MSSSFKLSLLQQSPVSNDREFLPFRGGDSPLARGKEPIIFAESPPPGVRTDAYRVSISATPNWRTYSLCSLDISIGNAGESGQKLGAAVEWIGKRFEHCIINLGDALYRHKLNNDLISTDLALKRAIGLGDRWLEENRVFLSGFSIPYTVVRWMEWLNHKDFNKVHNDLWGLYATDREFYDKIEHDLNAFTKRNEKRGRYFSGREIQNARKYIMEELAVHRIMSREFRLARIYRGDRLLAAGYLSSYGTGLENEAYIKLDFKRKKGPSHQKESSN